MSTLPRILATTCMLCLFTLPGCSSVSRSADADWLSYNRTLAGDRFSPRKEIDHSNVAQLKAICTYTLPEVSSLRTGPLVVDGRMYFTTDEGSYAIDASTCAEKWKQHRRSDTTSMLLVHRGFAYTNGRLFEVPRTRTCLRWTGLMAIRSGTTSLMCRDGAFRYLWGQSSASKANDALFLTCACLSGCFTDLYLSSRWGAVSSSFT
jgi:hypothetical protein